MPNPMPKKEASSSLQQRSISGCLVVVLVLAAIFCNFPLFLGCLWAGLSVESALAFGLVPSRQPPCPLRRPWVGWFSGLAYSSFALYSLFEVHRVYGEIFTLWIFTLLWLTDTGAYFVGRVFGKRKLAPRISPGKTWAGFWGGIVVATLVDGTVALLAVPRSLNLLKLVAFLSGLSLCAHLGDLLESVVKRRLGLKDMSQLIPGHGGLADRFDSLLLVSCMLGLMHLFVEQ